MGFFSKRKETKTTGGYESAPVARKSIQLEIDKIMQSTDALT
jgi:hypothetical protein